MLEIEWTQETREGERRVEPIEHLKGDAVVVDDGPTTLATATPILREIEGVVGKEKQDTLGDGDGGRLSDRKGDDPQMEQRVRWGWTTRR